jgi:hypothetical protein
VDVVGNSPNDPNAAATIKVTRIDGKYLVDY